MSSEVDTYFLENSGHVVATLNRFGVWHLSPCSDVGFKAVMNGDGDDGKSRAIRFISSFCRILDGSSFPPCRMLDNSTILGNRSVSEIENIPESLDHSGEIVIGKAKGTGKADSGDGRRGRGGEPPTGLPLHPRIDSGFVVAVEAVGVGCDGDGSEGTAGAESGTNFKIGIEMQVRDEGNMGARVVDYGTRIFRHRKAELNFPKTYELALVRWDAQNARDTILLVSGMPAGMLDHSAPAAIVSKHALCCAQIFLGAIRDALSLAMEALGSRAGPGMAPTEGDWAAGRKAISDAKDAEMKVLVGQMGALFKKGTTPFENWATEEQECVHRVGFFRYGNLMSAEDVENLNDGLLKKDYECMRIKEENIVEHRDIIEAIYGKPHPGFEDMCRNLNRKNEEIAARDGEIVRWKNETAARNEEIARLKKESARLKRKLKAATDSKRLVKTKRLGSRKVAGAKRPGPGGPGTAGAGRTAKRTEQAEWSRSDGSTTPPPGSSESSQSGGSSPDGTGVEFGFLTSKLRG
jgi:hypothetical protein